MHGIPQYLDACNDRRAFLQEQLDWLQEERAAHNTEIVQLEQKLQRNREEMAGYLIPDVSDDFLSELEQRLSYPSLLPMKREYEKRFEEAEQRRIELEAMNEVKLHEYTLREAERKIEEERPAYDQARSEIGKWEKIRWHRKLDRAGYYDANYRAGLLRRFFDWRAVSLLMAAMEKSGEQKFSHPDELKEYFRAVRDKVDEATAAYQEVVDARDRVIALKKEHEEILTVPERLLAELYQSLGTAAVDHLMACPEEVQLDQVKRDRNLSLFLKKAAGLAKQSQYLKELAVATIDARVQQVEAELAKLDQKIRKLNLQRARGKRKFYSDDDLQRVRSVKAEKWGKRRMKTAKMRNRISEFHDYDAGSFVGAYLWWDLITRGANTNDIYEVREHRQRNPDWDYRTFHDPASWDDDVDSGPGVIDDAAAALASSMASESINDFFDPS